MKEHTLMWVDPPRGWQYGFPKLYNPNEDGDLWEWLVNNGYPASELTPLTQVSFIDAEVEHEE